MGVAISWGQRILDLRLVFHAARPYQNINYGTQLIKLILLLKLLREYGFLFLACFRQVTHNVHTTC